MVEVKLSENETGIGGFKKNSRYMDVSGWRVGIVPEVRFDLGDADFFVKVVFTPGEEVSFAARQPRLIGLFPVDLHKARAGARDARAHKPAAPAHSLKRRAAPIERSPRRSGKRQRRSRPSGRGARPA